MSKFLRTVQNIDKLNQKVILQVESCTQCPLMKFHQQNCLATCRVFSDKQTNVVDDFVLNYNASTGQIYDDIPIPNWCLLPDQKSQLDFEAKTYVVHGDKVLTSNAIADPDLPLVIASGVDGELIFRRKEDEENDELGISELLPALVAASVFAPKTLTADEAYEQAYDDYDDYDLFDVQQGFSRSVHQTINKHEICSLCGEEDETVSRNTNHGMCDDCWKVSYKNDKRKKQAYINNFRMKRGESFKSEIYNTSILKTDNLKVLIKV